MLLLKAARKLYVHFNPSSAFSGRNWKMFSNKDYSNELIYNYLQNDRPCMIGRFGSSEMQCLLNYKGVKDNHRNWISYTRGQSLKWWWEPKAIKQLQVWSGFFPSTVSDTEKFCELMISDIPEVDILGSWLKEESFFEGYLQNAKRVVLEDLEPFFSRRPWTRALEGKKVLVVHPFADTIESQYVKKDYLFDNGLLPEFKLLTIKAVQSIAGEKTGFKNWFDALDHMKEQVDKKDFDICIIGCGAYGFPLAAHVKRMGKKGFHLAGATQLLFGIKGKRWEEFVVWPYKNLFNEFWVRPGEKEKPANAKLVEDSCYW